MQFAAEAIKRKLRFRLWRQIKLHGSDNSLLLSTDRKDILFTVDQTSIEAFNDRKIGKSVEL